MCDWEKAGIMIMFACEDLLITCAHVESGRSGMAFEILDGLWVIEKNLDNNFSTLYKYVTS